MSSANEKVCRLAHLDALTFAKEARHLTLQIDLRARQPKVGSLQLTMLRVLSRN